MKFICKTIFEDSFSNKKVHMNLKCAKVMCKITKFILKCVCTRIMCNSVF